MSKYFQDNSPNPIKLSLNRVAIAAKRTGITRQILQRAIKAGTLPHSITQCGLPLVSIVDVLRWDNDRRRRWARKVEAENREAKRQAKRDAKTAPDDNLDSLPDSPNPTQDPDQPNNDPPRN